MVERFVEKPSIELAKEYIATEEYLWNSGMFIWKVSTILDNISKYLPDTYQKLMKIRESIGTIEERKALEEEFHAIQSQSIDYGVMEKADDIFTVPGTFGWDDVGSWLAVERLQKSDEHGNVIKGHVVNVATKRCIIQGEQKLLAVIGMEDTIMVDTPDATLICHKDCAGEIKKIVESLKNSNQDNLI